MPVTSFVSDIYTYIHTKILIYIAPKMQNEPEALAQGDQAAKADWKT